MAFETKKYIIDLTKQLNLRNMDDAQRARLADLKKKGVATGKQQKWDPDAPTPQIDANDGTTYAYTDTGTAPNIDDLKDLYLKLVVILRDVASDKDLKDDDKVKKFLGEFYGNNKAIDFFSINPINGSNEIAQYIEQNLSEFVRMFNNLGTSWGRRGEFAIKEKDLKDLADALRHNTYQNDPKAIKTLEKFLDRLQMAEGSTPPIPLPTNYFPSCWTPTTHGTTSLDLIEKLSEEIKTPADPNVTQLQQMAAGVTTLSRAGNPGLGAMFGKLIADDKLREKVLSKDTDGDITKWITKGLNETNYKDGDHKLAPKYEDRKKWFQRAKNKVIEKYGDTLGKLKNKHSRHKYSTNARFVVEQLIKKGIGPTSGMDKLFNTLGSIMGELPNPVQKQLDWVTKTLKKLSGATFFKEALSDGHQMRQLVQEVIKAAVHDNKKEEAKVALEMLSVMRYTMTTSSVRDNLKKTDFTIFSDSNLSANKNEFVQAFTKATDKLIKAAVMGAFEIGNLAKNAIKTSGVKFGHGTGHLDKRTTESIEYKDAEKKATMDELFAFWDFVNSSGQSKSYNIFKSQKKIQAKADQVVNPGTSHFVRVDGVTHSIDDATAQEEKFLDYFQRHNIGRA